MKNNVEEFCQTILPNLTGKVAWGLVRTHGSMFFLEIGSPVIRPGDKRSHGEWHFLFENTTWRFHLNNRIIGSDDDGGIIDSVFAEAELGQIETALLDPEANDVRVRFSTGGILRTFWSGPNCEEPTVQWMLFGPEDRVWICEGPDSLVERTAG